jgi:hypothetical protein
MSICGVGASGIADDGTAGITAERAVAAAREAVSGSCASRLHDNPRKATPRTSRRPAPIKPNCIHSPVLRAGAGRRELPKRQIGSGRTPLGSLLVRSFLLADPPNQRQQAASLIIDSFSRLDAREGPLETEMSHFAHPGGRRSAMKSGDLPVLAGLSEYRRPALRNRYIRVGDRC